MYHIPGINPEAPNLEAAFNGNKPERTIRIGRGDLKRVYDLINYASNDDVEFVYLGCPHYNIQELQKVSGLLDGKKCKIPLWVMTNPLTFRNAEIMGLKYIIQKAGGVLLSGSCPGLLMGEMPTDAVMATDAVKQNYYITGILHPKKLDAWYGSMEDCIEAAITGKWKGEWR